MSASIIAPYEPAMYEVKSTTRTPARGPVCISRGFASGGQVPGDQLAVVLGVAVHDLQRFGALEVQVQVVLPREADAAVSLDGLAAHPARRLAHVGLANRGGDGGVLGARLQR